MPAGTIRLHRVLRDFTTGQAHSFGGEYRELVPFESIRYTDRFDDPSLHGEMQTTVPLKPMSCGTEVFVVQEGIPEANPLEVCYFECRTRSHNLQRSSGPRFRRNDVMPDPWLQRGCRGLRTLRAVEAALRERGCEY